ncbi:MAG: hypothetical protein WKG07_33630 [Hymenobacter sp.]
MQYPFHKVCGEYVSNEYCPILRLAARRPDRAGSGHHRQLYAVVAGRAQPRGSARFGRVRSEPLRAG